MNIMHVVGNRPQFIKIAPVSREIQKRSHEQFVVHTGQHYDGNMSQIFFEELGIPQPKINLGVGSGTHAQVIAKVVSRLDKVIENEKPDAVLIYGDTNSTLASAIVVSRRGIPLFHVEAGPRTNSRTNPEEQNRIVTDHLSDYLFAPDKASVDNLKKEGISERRIIFSGDVMYDQYLYTVVNGKDISLEKYPDDFILMTWHRQENTCSKYRMETMLSFIEHIKYKIVFPIHPRTRKLLTEYGLWRRAQENHNLVIVEPVGYKEMVMLLHRCRLLISDSGGASKEASFAGKICYFPLELRIWPELERLGYIKRVNIEDKHSVECCIGKIEKLLRSDANLLPVDCFGNGHATELIVDTIEKAI